MKKKLSTLLIALLMITALPLQTYAESEICSHIWGDWIISIEPTCSETGSQYRICDKCGHEEEIPISATGQHDWDEWQKTKSPTVNKTGVKERECIECGAAQTKKIAKLKPFVKLSKKTINLKVGQTYKLNPKYAKGDTVKKYESSSKKIATVSNKGKIKAKAKGTAKITVVMKSGKKATCTVRIKAKKASSNSGNAGGSIGNSGGNGNAGSGTNIGTTVYWTPNGEVYHSTSSCRTLSRSKTIYSGTLSECPKSRGCKVCY